MGLDYHYDDIHHTKTLLAHELLHFAKGQGKQLETAEAAREAARRQQMEERAAALAAAGDARVVSVYGSAVRFAAQNQVVVINKGTADGVESGHVLAIQKYGERMVDKTDAARAAMKLERRIADHPLRLGVPELRRGGLFGWQVGHVPA